MHLIINSLDTRRWMSDGGFAGGWWPGKGCKAGGGDGWFVARARDEGKRIEGGWGTERRMVVWRKVGGADEGKG